MQFWLLKSELTPPPPTNPGRKLATQPSKKQVVTSRTSTPSGNHWFSKSKILSGWNHFFCRFLHLCTCGSVPGTIFIDKQSCTDVFQWRCAAIPSRVTLCAEVIVSKNQSNYENYYSNITHNMEAVELSDSLKSEWAIMHNMLCHQASKCRLNFSIGYESNRVESPLGMKMTEWHNFIWKFSSKLFDDRK